MPTVEEIVTDFENDLLELLQDRLKTYPKGKFRIEDIFGKEWDRLPTNKTRQSVGRKFADLVKYKKVPNVEFSKKDGSNTQYYEKI